MLIAIIGSNGFIGSNAVDFFNSGGHKVIGCDIADNLHEGIMYYKVKSSASDFQSIFEENQFDVCINASGSANVGLSFKNPNLDYDLNVTNVFNLLEAIRISGQSCRFINFSSAAVYGNPESLPISETHPLNPISPYGFHKLEAENICREFSSLFSVPTCNLRVFSAFGERLRKQLFWDVYLQALNNRNVVLFGTGHESRDFIYIRDLLKAVEIVISKGNFEGEIINVATGVETEITEAIDIFLSIFDRSIPSSFSGGEKKGDPLNWRADISKLASYGFIPEYNLQSGLKNYCEWLKAM